MAQDIDKDALVAEIERLYQEHSSKEYIDEGGVVLCQLEDFLDTLEVKEWDLEKELDSWRHNHFHGRRDKEASGEYFERSSQLDLAKHFFELGMSVSNIAQKGE